MLIANTVLRLTCLSICLAALAWPQPPRPNFTGTWKLNVAASTHPPTSEVDRIDHRDPVIIITPTGRGDASRSIEDRTDGEELRDKVVTSGRIRAAHWEGNQLVLETKTPNYGGMNGLCREVMSLSEDGKVMRREIHDGGGNQPWQILVFDKVSGDSEAAKEK